MSSAKHIPFYRVLLTAMLVLLISLNGIADSIVSPFNAKKIAIADSASYEFIVTGHLHGASYNKSGFPAASLLANIDTLNKLQPAFMISLGDLFMAVNPESINNYNRSFFSRIGFPLFNAVGNHDVNDLYKEKFGATWFAFSTPSEACIILDTEVNDGKIEGDQKKFLEAQMSQAMSDTRIKNIFIFSHRPVWSENNPRYSSIFSGQTRTEVGSNNFESDIRPLLIGASRTKNVFWMSGSLGVAPASFFYAKEDGYNLTFIQTAIRDLPRDAALRVKVDNGKVSFVPFSFTGQPLEAIEKYNAEFWKSSTPAEEKFNYRLLPLMIKQTLMHPYFWWGAGITAVIFLLISRLRRKRKRHAASN